MFVVRRNLVVRFISGARQSACLPCIFYIAHDKEKHTPNKLFVVHLKKTHGKDLVCRVFCYSARQRIFLPLRIPNNPNEILFKILCRAHSIRRTENTCVCSALLL
jgi:hypothetical protein